MDTRKKVDMENSYSALNPHTGLSNSIQLRMPHTHIVHVMDVIHNDVMDVNIRVGIMTTDMLELSLLQYIYILYMHRYTAFTLAIQDTTKQILSQYLSKAISGGTCNTLHSTHMC